MTGFSFNGKEPKKFHVVLVDENDNPLNPSGNFGVVARYEDKVRLVCLAPSQFDAETIASMLSGAINTEQPTLATSKPKRIKRILRRGQ